MSAYPPPPAVSFVSSGDSDGIAQKNDKDWTVQKRLLSARRASQMAVFDNEIERWGEVDVPPVSVDRKL
ncbi:hypothetical protein J6590_081903 [Homalodisca vitripennis]|nr:hypothetical protein J6590_081903 [Homalodisca vitripennis]